jgi:hypothetical protein
MLASDRLFNFIKHDPDAIAQAAETFGPRNDGSRRVFLRSRTMDGSGFLVRVWDREDGSLIVEKSGVIVLLGIAGSARVDMECRP